LTDCIQIAKASNNHQPCPHTARVSSWLRSWCDRVFRWRCGVAQVVLHLQIQRWGARQ